MVKRSTNAPPPVPTVHGGGVHYVPRVDTQTAGARLGPLLFGDTWIQKLTLQEEWLIEQGKLDDEPTAKAESRQHLMEFQHRKVGDWLTERRITYLWQFEQALAREFPDGAQLGGEQARGSALPSTPASRKGRRAHNNIDDDAPIKRMNLAITKSNVSMNQAALIEARKITGKVSGTEVDSVKSRLKRKYTVKYGGR
jgi:hypothetical protein